MAVIRPEWGADRGPDEYAPPDRRAKEIRLINPLSRFRASDLLSKVILRAAPQPI